MKRLGYFSLFCLSLSAALLASSANAQLTEAYALERGMTRASVEALFDARLDQARGAQDSAGRWANPEVEYNRENMDLPSGRSEESTWWIKQRLNIAGVNGIERDAAAQSLEATEAQVTLQRRQWRTQIREQFYATLAAQMRTEVLAEHHQRLEQIALVIEQRVEEGDASRYDQLRMAQEVARAQSLYSEAKAKHQAERQQLFALIGGAPQTLTGNLLPPPLEPSQQSSSSTLEQHPQLQMLAAQEQSASLSAKAARRGSWPEVSLGLGRKFLDEPGLSAEGNAVALSIEIPLFDRNRGEAQRARGQAREYAADLALTRHRLRARQQALYTTLTAQRESAVAFKQATQAGENSLSAITEASYQAGELTIMELVDAYRTELDTWQQYLDSAQAARNTFIEIQLLEGRR